MARPYTAEVRCARQTVSPVGLRHSIEVQGGLVCQMLGNLAFPGPVRFLRRSGVSAGPRAVGTSAGAATAQGLGLPAPAEGAAPGPSLV